MRFQDKVCSRIQNLFKRRLWEDYLKKPTLVSCRLQSKL